MEKPPRRDKVHIPVRGCLFGAIGLIAIIGLGYVGFVFGWDPTSESIQQPTQVTTPASRPRTPTRAVNLPVLPPPPPGDGTATSDPPGTAGPLNTFPTSLVQSTTTPQPTEEIIPEELPTEVDPDVERRYRSAVAFQEASDYDRARAAFQELVTLNPDYKDVAARLKQVNETLAEAFYQQGVAYANDQLWEEAAAAYARTLEIIPNYRDAAAQRAHALRALQVSPTPVTPTRVRPRLSPTPVGTQVSPTAETTATSGSPTSPALPTSARPEPEATAGSPEPEATAGSPEPEATAGSPESEEQSESEERPGDGLSVPEPPGN